CDRIEIQAEQALPRHEPAHLADGVGVEALCPFHLHHGKGEEVGLQQAVAGQHGRKEEEDQKVPGAGRRLSPFLQDLGWPVAGYTLAGTGSSSNSTSSMAAPASRSRPARSS